LLLLIFFFFLFWFFSSNISVFSHIPSLLRSLQTREAKPKTGIFLGTKKLTSITIAGRLTAKYIPYSNRQDVQQTRSTFANYLPTYLPTYPTNRHTTFGDQFRQFFFFFLNLKTCQCFKWFWRVSITKSNKNKIKLNHNKYHNIWVWQDVR
jgi:hypothetical protein